MDVSGLRSELSGGFLSAGRGGARSGTKHRGTRVANRFSHSQKHRYISDMSSSLDVCSTLPPDTSPPSTGRESIYLPILHFEAKTQVFKSALPTQPNAGTAPPIRQKKYL